MMTSNDNILHRFEGRWMDHAEITRLLLDTVLQDKKKYVSEKYYQSIWGSMRLVFQNLYDTKGNSDRRDDELGRYVAIQLSSLAYLCEIDLKWSTNKLCSIFPPVKKYLIDTPIILPDVYRIRGDNTAYNPHKKNDDFGFNS